MGVKFLASILIATASGAAALAASLSTVQVPTMHFSESVSAVIVGSVLIVAGSAMRRTGVSK
jgi:hypothetical protein